MIKNDYSKKMIEQFKLALIEINDLREQFKYEETIECIHRWTKDILKLDWRIMGPLNNDDLIELIKEKGSLNSDKCIVFARLIQEQAKTYEAMDSTNESVNNYIRALDFLLEAFINNNSPELISEYSEIVAIYDTVSEYELPLNIKSMLFEYYTQNNNFCTAEDILYQILDEYEYDKIVVNIGIDFYKKLLTKSDEELETNDFPRSEVESGLASLRKKLI